MKPSYRIPLALAGALVLGLGGWVFWSMCPSCMSRCVIQQDLLIRKVVKHEYLQLGIRDDAAAVDEFLRANPACCELIRPQPSDAASKMSLAYPNEVHITYRVPENQRSYHPAPYYRIYVEVDECGNLGESAGQQLQTPN
jgi:hypothetical protein